MRTVQDLAHRVSSSSLLGLPPKPYRTPPNHTGLPPTLTETSPNPHSFQPAYRDSPQAQGDSPQPQPAKCLAVAHCVWELLKVIVLQLQEHQLIAVANGYTERELAITPDNGYTETSTNQTLYNV